jgi:hypothetical protein
MVMLNVILPSVIMLNVIILSVIMLSVVTPLKFVGSSPTAGIGREKVAKKASLF